MEEEAKYFYYYRDKNKAPRITVCLLITDKGISRGVAICSKKDRPNKSLGRSIAYGRAKKAQDCYYHYKGGVILRGEVVDLIEHCNATDILSHKSVQLHDRRLLTDYEKKIVKKEYLS